MALTARDTFWFSFAEQIYKNFYLTEYMKRLRKEDKVLEIFLVSISSTSIAAWAFWKKLPFLWAGLTALAQFVSLIKPYFKHAENITCINFCLLEFEPIIADMRSQWYTIESLSDEQIYKVCSKFEKRMLELELKYITILDLPTKESCRKKAMESRDAQLASLFDIKESGVKV